MAQRHGSCLEVSYSQKQLYEGVLEYFVKFPGTHLYRHLFLSSLHSCDYLKNIAIKLNVATDEGNSQK